MHIKILSFEHEYHNQKNIIIQTQNQKLLQHNNLHKRLYFRHYKHIHKCIDKCKYNDIVKCNYSCIGDSICQM